MSKLYFDGDEVVAMAWGTQDVASFGIGNDTPWTPTPPEPQIVVLDCFRLRGIDSNPKTLVTDND